VGTWSDIATEIQQAKTTGDANFFDTVRRRHLAALAAYTKRDTILYASRFMQPGAHVPDAESIIDEDLQALMEVCDGLKGGNLDLILHSPGGSAEATEAIVSYLRHQYSSIRAIVPHLAMSAATMWACSTDEILMGPQSSQGPIDPQMRYVDERGVPTMIPAQAIIDQFRLAQQQASHPGGLPAWVPILRSYAPALLVQCQDAMDLSKELVKGWLRDYMLKGTKYVYRDAARIAKGLSDHKETKSHARHLNRETARAIGGGHVGLRVTDLEGDATLEREVMSVYQATMHVFAAAPQVAKIVENHQGKAFVKIAGAVAIGRPGLGAPSPGMPVPSPVPPAPGAPAAPRVSPPPTVP
jgi:hypothetical protein